MICEQTKSHTLKQVDMVNLKALEASLDGVKNVLSVPGSETPQECSNSGMTYLAAKAFLVDDPNLFWRLAVEKEISAVGIRHGAPYLS